MAQRVRSAVKDARITYQMPGRIFSALREKGKRQIRLEMGRERVCLVECLLAVVSAGVVLFASAAAGTDAGERANEEK